MTTEPNKAGPTFNELRNALVAWRAAERSMADVVLRGSPLKDIHAAAYNEKTALHDLRKIVDSEPWSDIIQSL